jgi:hypothetical protein
VLEWVNFITTELHKNFAPMFSDRGRRGYQGIPSRHDRQRLEYVEGRMGQGPS